MKLQYNNNINQRRGCLTLNEDEALNLPIEDVLAQLETSHNGLTSREAEDRLETYGYNELIKRKKRFFLLDFLSYFKNPLIIILLIAGSISGFLGEAVDTVIIFTIVILGVSLNFYQEKKADKAAEMLREKVSTSATVLRDNIKQEVKITQIVPGDIIELATGDMVPGDARVITAKDFFVNQSALTGESFPVEKIPEALTKKSATIVEWNNYVFLGTSVVSGSATAVVLKTGNSTVYGKIAEKLVVTGPETEAERGLKRFGFMIMQFVLFLVLFVFFVNALLKGRLIESLLFAIALAVGLTPDLLPMILSINLSKSAIAMSKKDVIVKRLSSIHNFGSMDVLCTDKTGTLTENRVTLVLHVDLEGINDDKVLLFSFLNSFHQTGIKNPLDQAVLEQKNIDISNYQKIDEIPFDFTRKRVSVVVEHENQRELITKGAPEEIIHTCSHYEIKEAVSDLKDDLRQKIDKKYQDLSSEGFRVLAISYKKVGGEKSVYSITDESKMIFLGFIAFIDPPKATAKESIKLLQNAGIEVKILTGDNDLVTKKTCEQLGFEIKGIYRGDQILQMQNDALSIIVENANIFARVTPAQKDRIINLLKGHGHVVGYLGDGINDAPSLKESDIGITVENAVDVAKESSDVILMKKSLRVLYDGVLEGRKTFGNSMKYIMMGISSNFGNMFSVAGASVFLPFLPMNPVQILLNNLLYDLSQTTIPTDNVDSEYIKKPKKWDISFIKRAMIVFGLISSIFDFLTFYILLNFFKATEPLFQTGWFIESLITQTLVIFIIRTRISPFYKSRPSNFLIYSTFGVIGFTLIVTLTPLGDIFGFVGPPAFFFLILAGLIGLYLLIVEITKRWFYHRYSYRLDK